MSGRAYPVTFDALPLYASDEQIGAAILGPTRAREWCALASALELQGLPVVDKLHGGRFTPGVRRFYDLRHGIASGTMSGVDGAEDWSKWANRKRRQG